MTNPVLLAAAAAAALAILPAPRAAAHITLETAQAAPNTWLRAVFRVPHGCGDAATTGIVVRLPAGISGARPMPKPGWTLAIAPRDPNAPPPAGHGEIAEAGEIAWRGGHLPNAHYDEFVIRFRTPNTPGETVWIPVIQECEGGLRTEWTQVPAPGQRITDLPTPAPSLRILAPSR
ncbi:MAG: YcnI family protein [Acetobacteraceae bacterium]|nr:YcnI family protein [Acetobacteraceae bacterium]